MKRIFVAICVLASVSCKKEVKVNNEGLNTSIQSSNGSDALAETLNRQTKFGCVIGGGFSNDQNVNMAKNLNVNYVRSAIIMSDWDGKFLPYESYTANGINVLLNVCTSPYTAGRAPFPKDLLSYRQKLTNITNTYQPEMIVIENEEINKNSHSGPLTDYIAMLKVAFNVCHFKGIKVTNGGIYGVGLNILTYRYLQTKGQSRADSFGKNCMEAYQIKAAQKPNSNASLEGDARRIDTLLTSYAGEVVDYVNLHLYEPFNPAIFNDVSKASKVTTASHGVVADLQEYIKVRTGKQAITNETGQRNNVNPDLVTSMLAEYDRLKFPYVIWFSGDGLGVAQPLFNLNTGSFYSNGVAFSNFMAAY